MTQYVVNGPAPTFSSAGSTETWSHTFQLSLTAVNKYILITKIERAGTQRANGSFGIHYSLTQYAGATVSGGSGTITPGPLRSWAAASSATSRYGRVGDANNVTSGNHVITSTPITFTGGTSIALRSEITQVTTTLNTSVADYQFPGQYIIAPGTTLLIAGVATTGTYPGTITAGYYAFTTVNVYFDELELARSA